MSPLGRSGGLGRVPGVAWRSARAFRPGGPRRRDRCGWRHAAAVLSLPAWLLVTAIAAVSGGLATMGTASVILTGQRPVGVVVARVGAVAGAAVVLLAGLTAAALQVPALAPAFLTLMGALQVLVVVVAVSLVALLASTSAVTVGDPLAGQTLPSTRPCGRLARTAHRGRGSSPWGRWSRHPAASTASPPWSMSCSPRSTTS